MKEPFKKEAILHCLVCALWSSIDDNNEPMDANYGVDDIDSETVKELTHQLSEFIDNSEEIIERVGMSAEQFGHDFWLTRNGRGAGFWDRGYGSDGTALTEKVKFYGSMDLYVTDGGTIHHM